MSAGSLNQHPQLQNVLNLCRRQIFLHTLIRGLATVVAVAIGCVLVATFFDYLFGLSSVIRSVSLVAAIVLTGWATWQALVKPLLQSMSLQQLGAVVDLSCPEFDESIATLLSLSGPNVSSGEAGSAVMRGYLERQVTERLSCADTGNLVDGAETQRRSGFAAALFAVALLPLLLWPTGSQLLLQRMVSPLSNLATATNLHFEIQNPNRTVARGSTVVFAAVPMWRTDVHAERPEGVKLQLIAEDGRRDALAMSYDELAGGYVAQVARIADSIQYKVVGGGAETQLYSIQVVDAPQIHGAIMAAVPPQYTGQAVKHFDGMIGQMPVFERSDIEIQLEFNKPVESVALVWIRRDARPISEVQEFDRKFDHATGEEVIEKLFDDWDPSRSVQEKVKQANPEDEDPDAPLNPQNEPLISRVEGALSGDGRSALITMTADVGGDFVFEVLDEYGLKNQAEPDRAITVIYDSPPELILRGVRADDRFRPDDILPIDVIAIDDIGIGAVELHYRINEDVTRIVAATDFERGAREVTHGFRLQLDQLSVKSTDTVTFRVRAADERPEPGIQETWSEEITVRIDNNAEAAGAKALAKEVKAIVETLKRLEQEVAADKQKAQELKDKAPQTWDEAARTEASRLSEKEQQQGRILEKIAQTVAQHPLMKDAAGELQQLAKELKDNVPQNLDEASSASRNEAKDRMAAAEQQLEGVGAELHQQIEQIEKIGQLEQDLAELNRLALEAEQLAADAEQLDQDRGDKESRPQEMEQKEWEQALQDRQQQLGEQQQKLAGDLERLLQEERELLAAAQRAQREQMVKISDAARELSEQQRGVAEGVQQEAKEAGQDAHEVARNLERVSDEAEKLNQQLQQQAPNVAKTDVEALKQAAENLRGGDLAEPQADVQQAAKDLQNTDQQLQAADTGNTEMTPEQRQQAAQRATELAEQLAQIEQQIGQLRQERNATAEANKADELPLTETPEGNSRVEDLLQRLDELAEVADEMATGLEADSIATEAAHQTARQAADRAQQGSKDAQAGKFSQAAQEIRQAGDAATASSQKMDAARQSDQQGQMAGLSDEFRRTAETLENLKLDDGSQATAQQMSQQGIAEQAAELPEKLAELSERLNMEALQMANEAQQAGQAQQSAAQAQQSSQQASSELQSGQLQHAAQTGQQTAQQLKQLSEAVQPAGSMPGEEGSLVPSEVGESVAEALQNLAQAAQTMQQSPQPGSEGQPGESGESAEQASNGKPGDPSNGEQTAQGEGQPSDGQSGESGQPGQQGQPGQGKPSGSQQLSSAAESLAQAAQQALPNQFTPGQNAEGSESDAAGADSTGNAAMWNGLLPGQANAAQGNRNWGQSNQELETETSSGQGVSRDSEYQALIRMYFREIAKSSGHPDR